MFVRILKVPASGGGVDEYVRVVESFRESGKVKQRTVVDLGRKDVLASVLPGLLRVLCGGELPADLEAGADILDASTWGPALVVRTLFERLGLWAVLDEHLGASKDGPFADRAFVLVANRLIRPASEHALAGWLETDFLCDRAGRRFTPNWRRRNRVRVHPAQLDKWYRTLDRLAAAKDRVEVALYRRLCDLFSIRPDLVLYDLTSTYFEGAGPADFAKHGHSRDGKRRNVQVVVGVVMVAGWPIAHHVWAGRRKDATTVQEVVADLKNRFSFGRVVFVGDRGMVSEENLEALAKEGHGCLVGVKRRRNGRLDEWLGRLDESKWLDCPPSVAAGEKKGAAPRTRVQEVASGVDGVRVFVIDSEERRAYEQAQRERSMERTRVLLECLRERVMKGRLKDASKIGAAAARALAAHHGHRYYAWELTAGGFAYREHEVHLEREKRLEGKYVLQTSEAATTAVEAVCFYKELTEVERTFRCMKDVLVMRPIHHQVEPRVKAHIFVAALGALLTRYLEKELDRGGCDLSAEQALEAVATLRVVEFQLPGRPKRRGVSAGSAAARSVLKALGVRDVRPPEPPPEQETRW